MGFVHTESDLKSIGEVSKLRPREEQFAGRKGYKRRYREDGSYTWAYDFKPNDHGKVTREASEVTEAMTPFIAADTQRHYSREGKRDRAVLKDADGQRRFVDPSLAEETVRRTGWSHGWRAGGVRVERGIRGMLFRLIAGRWEPTGRLRLGIDGRECPKAAIQFDPDGNPWRFMRETRAWEAI